jgi:hypothetical protein
LERAMLTLTNAALTILPFVLICIAVRLWMRNRKVDLSEVQKQAGPNRRPRKVFLLGFWRTEE